MKTRTLQRSLVLVAVAAGVLAAGCELIVDFDRSTIPVELPGELPDAAPSGERDATTPVEEAGVETDAEPPAEDAGVDTDEDASADAEADAPV